MLKRKDALILCLVCFMFISVSCNLFAAATYKLRLGHNQPETHPYHLGAVKFAEILKAKSKGRIIIDIYPQAQLGEQKQMLEMVTAGTLDICESWQGSLEQYDPSLGVTTLPFLFENWDHVWKVMDSPIGQNVFGNLQRNNIKVLTCFYNGAYNIVGNAAIRKVNDLKGKKVRVQPSAVFTRIFEALGCVVTPLPFSEVYTALQLGTVDLQIQNPINIEESRQYEVAKYTTEVNMFYLLEPVSMSLKSLNKFSKKDQKLIQDSAREAAVWQRAMSEKREKESKKFIIKKGMKYLNTNVAPWKKTVESIYKQEFKRYPKWEGIVEKIRAMK
jgi:tripartite ATP-independent transporter DctP family solute receptor